MPPKWAATLNRPSQPARGLANMRLTSHATGVPMSVLNSAHVAPSATLVDDRLARRLG